MTCDRIRPLLSHYHDDALSMEERARVRLHLATCGDCGAILAAYEGMYGVLYSTAMPVPADLRRNVYARIAEIEARRGMRLPFGPALLGMLRSAGGTAGLLAVLGGLIAAALHLTNTPSTAGPVLAAAPAASTAVSNMVGALRRGDATKLPVVEQTAVASLHKDLVEGASVTVDQAVSKDGDVAVKGKIIHTVRASGAESGVTAYQAIVSVPKPHAMPIVKSLSTGTLTPVPLIPASDGLIYLHLHGDEPYLDKGNTTGELEWHAFAPGSQPRVLFTPVPTSVQLLTGITASPDGYRVAYTADGQNGYGGIFGFNTNAPYPTRLLPMDDRARPNQGSDHLFVKQPYFAANGRMVFSMSNDQLVSVAITTSPHEVRQIKQLGMGLWSNYVVSPDMSRITWVHHPVSSTGMLQIATLTTPPLTTTIAVGHGRMWSSHPVWSPDGRSLLFLSGKTPDPFRSGLYLWTQHGGAARELVPGDPTGRQIISNFAWAPGGRYFTYVVTTLDPHGTSAVYLGDTQVGYTWLAFKRRFVGALAWVHGGALAAHGATPASSTVPAAPPEITLQSGATQFNTNVPGIFGLPYGSGSIYVQLRFARPVDPRTVVVRALSPDWTVEQKNAPAADSAAVSLRGIAPGSTQVVVTQARGWDGRALLARPLTLTVQAFPPPVAVPAPFADTSTPAGTLMSFYNALTRREYKRAYSYLAGYDGHTLAEFTHGYADTKSISVTRLLKPTYQTGGNAQAVTCVGIQIVGHHWNGVDKTYGGWYMLRGTGGQAARYSGWRIVMDAGTSMHENFPAVLPPRSQCGGTRSQPQAHAILKASASAGG